MLIWTVPRAALVALAPETITDYANSFAPILLLNLSVESLSCDRFCSRREETLHSVSQAAHSPCVHHHPGPLFRSNLA